MLRNLFVLAVVLFGASSLRAADEAKPADPAVQPKITFDEHIAPILREHCSTCHNQNEAKSDLALDSFARTMQGGAGGEVVIPGDAENSRLYALVSHLETPVMPPNQDKIADAKIDLLKKWIVGGALENSGSKAKLKPKVELKLVATEGNKPSGPPAMPEKFRREPFVATSRPGATTAIAADPWAPLVAAAGQKQIMLYNSDTLQLLTILAFPEGVPHVLKFSRNGAVLLAGGGRGGASGKVVLFDVKTGNRITEIGDEYDIVLAADVSRDLSLVALGGPKKVVRVYNVSDGSQEYELKKHTDWINSLEFSPDGLLLATADRSAGLIVWEAATGREFQNLTGHSGSITDVSWRSDSNVLASCSEDGTVKLWEMNTGKMLKSWSANKGTQSVEFGMLGKLVSSGRDNRAKVWDVDGKQICETEEMPDMTLDAVLTYDQARVVVGDWSGQCGVYDAVSGKKLGSLSLNPLPIAERAAYMVRQLKDAENLVKSTAAEVAEAEKNLKAAKSAVAAAAANSDDTLTKIKQIERARPRLEKQIATSQKMAKEASDQLAGLRKALHTAAAAEDKAAAAANSQDSSEARKDLKKAQGQTRVAAGDLADMEAKVAKQTNEAKALSKELAAGEMSMEKLKSQIKSNKEAVEKAAVTQTAAEKHLVEKRAIAKWAAENVITARQAAEQAAADQAEADKLRNNQASAAP